MNTNEQRHAENEERYIEALDRWGLHGASEHVIVPEPIADMMRDGVPPVPMLLDDWLYVGELHWVYAEAEAFKTFLALILAKQVMESGERVVWFDEELGRRMIVERLLAIGADADVIENRFAYYAFPDFQAREHADGDDGNVHTATTHLETLRAIQPALVVYDTATDMLTAAGLDENSGRDVTLWVKTFPEQVRRLGITQLVLDHTAKGGDTAVGSRAKRAKAKVQYYLQVKERADKDTLGKLQVKLTKNTPGNPLPVERLYEIGGDGEGHFVFNLLETRAGSSPGARSQGKRLAVREQIVRVLQRDGDLNQSQLASVIDAGASMIREEARAMAEETHISGVESYKQGAAVMYRYVGPAGLPA